MKHIYKTLFVGLIIFLIKNGSTAQSISTPDISLDEIIINLPSPPWGMQFISSQEVIFTEKSGKLWRCNISSKTRTEITGVPAISQNGQGGLLDVSIHPDFSSNSFVYLSYAIDAQGGQTTAIGRGKLVGNKLENFTELFRALPVVNSGTHFGSRIAFDKDKFLYFSVGDRGNQDNAQNTNNHAGKVMRINADGTVPNDNPLVGKPNTRPEIFCWGNRNIQGMVMNPANGLIYAHEHGPRGGDEYNLIKKGINYGWPLITFGLNYNGTIVSEDTARDGLEQPLTYWVPSIAPCGLTFLTQSTKGDEAEVLIGALAGTHIHWLRLKNNKVVRSARFMNGYARFRDVEQAPDGSVYALTETPNRLIKLKMSNITSSAESQSSDSFFAQIFPNPSSDIASLSYSLNKTEKIIIKILAIDGSTQKILLDELVGAGNHELDLSQNQLPQGIYQIEIQKEGFKKILKWIKM
ncbi:MAG: T9SS C-terminal target domain-containing protein [Cytophagales bacterium]|nr:MAG: T9SS C-terminal target domain-containing protein [Cytophagales bacterium]